MGLRDRQAGKVIYVDRLEAVLTIPEHPKHRELPERPGNVVDQDVLFPKQDRWPQDCVRKAGMNQRVFEPGLSAEVLKVTVDRRIGDTDMNHSTHAGPLRRFKEPQRVVDRNAVREPSMVEANPIGVVEDFSALERRDEFVGLIERERQRLDAAPKWVLSIRRVGYGSDSDPAQVVVRRCTCRNTRRRRLQRGLLAYSSNQTGFLKAEVALLCHNDVVKDTKSENCGRFGQLLVCTAVNFAGLRVSGGMVMHKDNGSGPVGNGVREDLADEPGSCQAGRW